MYIKKFTYAIIIVMLIGFNVLTLASATVYGVLHGLLSSFPIVSSLVDNSMQNKNKKLQNKIEKSKKIVKKQRIMLTKNALKNMGKKTSGSLIPFAGVVIVAGISIEEYCNKLEDNIKLSNALNDTTDTFNYDKCYQQAGKDTGSIWQSFTDLF